MDNIKEMAAALDWANITYPLPACTLIDSTGAVWDAESSEDILGMTILPITARPLTGTVRIAVAGTVSRAQLEAVNGELDEGIIDRLGRRFDIVEDTALPQPDPVLSVMELGSLTLTPEFDPDETEYTAATTNDSDILHVEAKNRNTAAVTIALGESVIYNDQPVTWEDGENEITIAVEDTVLGQTESQEYTITVTKTDPPEPGPDDPEPEA